MLIFLDCYYKTVSTISMCLFLISTACALLQSSTNAPQRSSERLRVARQAPAEANVGVILPFDNSYLFSKWKLMPTIKLSQKYLAERSITHGFKFKFFDMDSKCSDTHGPIAAFDLYDQQKVNCFIGPMCDYSLSPVALYASEWAVPVLSPGGLSHMFGRDKLMDYTTLTRVGVTMESVTRSIVGIMKHFGWTKMKLLYQVDQTQIKLCYALNSAMIHTLNGTGIQGNYFMLKEGIRQEDKEEHLKKVATKLSGK